MGWDQTTIFQGQLPKQAKIVDQALSRSGSKTSSSVDLSWKTPWWFGEGNFVKDPMYSQDFNPDTNYGRDHQIQDLSLFGWAGGGINRGLVLWGRSDDLDTTLVKDPFPCTVFPGLQWLSILLA